MNSQPITPSPPQTRFRPLVPPSNQPRSVTYLASGAMLLLLLSLTVFLLMAEEERSYALGSLLLSASALLTCLFTIWVKTARRSPSVADAAIVFLILYLWVNSKIAIVPLAADHMFRLFLTAVLAYLTASLLMAQIPRIFFLSFLIFIPLVTVCLWFRTWTLQFPFTILFLFNISLIFCLGLLFSLFSYTLPRLLHTLRALLLAMLILLSLTLPLLLKMRVPEMLYEKRTDTIEFSKHVSKQIFEDSPYLGTGLNGLSFEVSLFELPGSITTIFIPSSYVWLSVETGIIGIGLLALFLLLVCLGSLRHFAHDPHPVNTRDALEQRAPLFVTILAGCTAWIWWTVAPVHLNPGLLLCTFILSGAAVGTQSWTAPGRSDEHTAPKKSPHTTFFRSPTLPRQLGKLLLSLLFLLGLAGFVRFSVTPAAARNLFNAAAKHDITSESYREILMKASSLQPGNPEYLIALAHHWRDFSSLPEVDAEQVFPQIEAAYLKAIDLNPFNESPYLELGRLYLLRRDPHPLIQLMKSAKRYLPFTPWIEITLANGLEAMGTYRSAAVALERASSLAPEHASLNLKLAMIEMKIGNANLALKNSRYLLQKHPVSTEGIILYRRLRSNRI